MRFWASSRSTLLQKKRIKFISANIDTARLNCHCEGGHAHLNIAPKSRIIDAGGSRVLVSKALARRPTAFYDCLLRSLVV